MNAFTVFDVAGVGVLILFISMIGMLGRLRPLSPIRIAFWTSWPELIATKPGDCLVWRSTTGNADSQIPAFESSASSALLVTAFGGAAGSFA
jgi:hypothetical protein